MPEGVERILEEIHLPKGDKPLEVRKNFRVIFLRDPRSVLVYDFNLSRDKKPSTKTIQTILNNLGPQFVLAILVSDTNGQFHAYCIRSGEGWDQLLGEFAMSPKLVIATKWSAEIFKPLELPTE